MDKKIEFESEKKPAEKPISLAPLKFEEAVSNLLKVKPEPEPKLTGYYISGHHTYLSICN